MSSRRRLRRIGCTEKQSYETLDLAVQACGALIRRTGERVHAYKCRFGRHFHVGHPTYRTRQALASRRGDA